MFSATDMYSNSVDVLSLGTFSTDISSFLNSGRGVDLIGELRDPLENGISSSNDERLNLQSLHHQIGEITDHQLENGFNS